MLCGQLPNCSKGTKTEIGDDWQVVGQEFLSHDWDGFKLLDCWSCVHDVKKIFIYLCYVGHKYIEAWVMWCSEVL